MTEGMLKKVTPYGVPQKTRPLTHPHTVSEIYNQPPLCQM